MGTWYWRLPALITLHPEAYPGYGPLSSFILSRGGGADRKRGGEGTGGKHGGGRGRGVSGRGFGPGNGFAVVNVGPSTLTTRWLVPATYSRSGPAWMEWQVGL